MYIYTADGHHFSHVERDRVTEGLLRYIVHLFVGVTRFVMLLYVCGGVFWWMRGKRRAWGQDLRNYNSRSKVKINQVPGGTFLKRSGPLARIKIKGKSHNVWWTMHSFNLNSMKYTYYYQGNEYIIRYFFISLTSIIFSSFFKRQILNSCNISVSRKFDHYTTTKMHNDNPHVPHNTGLHLKIIWKESRYWSSAPRINCSTYQRFTS